MRLSSTGFSALYLEDTTASSAYQVVGSDQLSTGSGSAFLVTNGAPAPLPAGLGPIEYIQQPQVGMNSEFIGQLSANGTAELTADATVTRGLKTVLLHVHVFETTTPSTHCVAQGSAIPLT